MSLGKLRVNTRLRLIREIASGAMGTVFEAEEEGAEGFTKRIAVKRLHPEMSKKRPFVNMFIQEAKLVAGLVHENIVQIYQFVSADRTYYILMEFVDGMPLSHLLRVLGATEKRLPRELAVFVAARVARGLAYAHSRRTASGEPLTVVHRDICPNNILINREGQPKIIDFGIATAANQSITIDEGSVCGKALYMSPEQARATGRVDFRTDIYALGTVLFQMLAGKPARPAGTFQQALELACSSMICWDALPGDLEPELVEILRTALAAEPEKRFGETDDFGKALEYEIYKSGYGPTIQTFEAYLRGEFPYLYAYEQPTQARLSEIERTVITQA